MPHHTIFSWFQRTSFLRITLLNFALLDELMTGFLLGGGLPLLRDQSGLNYEQIGLLFSVGAFSSLILEPIFNLLSDRSSKRWWILGGLLVLAFSYALAANTRNFIVLLIVFALIYPAIGVAVGLSEATLIDAAPHTATRTMTYWTLMSSIGDLLSPLIVAAFVAFGFGWSALCWFSVITWVVAGLIVWPQRFPRLASSTDEDDASSNVSILTGLRNALHDPLLLRWAALSILPTMLDEVFLGFSVLYLHDVLYASQEVVSMCVVAQMVGGLLGLLIVNRLLDRIAPQRLLKWLALLSLIGVVGLLTLHSILLATVALFIISLGAVGLYPIAQAEAYARQPGRSGTVRAVIGLGMPFEIVLPGVVGLVASRFGILAGVGLLGTASLLILLLVPWRTQI
jgi:predicted MFS family arabinose efflux permease